MESARAEHAVVKDEQIPSEELRHQHFKMYKPDQCLTQFVYTHSPKQRKRKGCRLLGDIYDRFPPGLMAIGRLDKDSEGLLLLTTDGKLSNQIRDTSVEKEYWVQVKGIITPQALELLQKGVEISTRSTDYSSITATNKDGKRSVTNYVYRTVSCKARRLDTEVVVERIMPAPSSKQAGDNNTSGPKKKKKKKRSFKGACKKCGNAGHRAGECPTHSRRPTEEGHHPTFDASTGTLGDSMDTHTVTAVVNPTATIIHRLPRGDSTSRTDYFR